MNYEALDKALKYLDDNEVVNEDGTMVAAGLAAVAIALVGVIALAVQNGKNKPIKNAIEDKKVQDSLKKIVSETQKGLESSAFKKYNKFVNYKVPYSYDIDKKATNDSTVVVKFPIMKFDVEGILKDQYNLKTDDDVEGFVYGDTQPYAKKAPKLKNYILGMLKDANSFVSKNINSKSKFSAQIVPAIKEPKKIEEELDEYYDSYLPGHGEDYLGINLVLSFDKKNFISKEV